LCCIDGPSASRSGDRRASARVRLIRDAKVPPAPPDAIEAREFFRRQIKRTGACEKTLFPNEASNYQLGGQFAAVAGFVLDRARKKGLGRDLPPEWFAQTLLP
jgi:hypothetical protein